MYGTTIRSYENKETKIKNKKDKSFYNVNEKRKENKKNKKKDLDTTYVNLNDTASNEVEDSKANESFSIKDLPIASVVITLILTMMMLVMTSGFGGL
ncbi:MAG: hypothetical protein IJX02_00350 [Clostridia bacterium]|nr:hypothetical protein [Clostridia bacterium]